MEVESLVRLIVSLHVSLFCLLTICLCLIGAGWGGCTVSLVPESHVDAFITKMRDTYPAYKGLEGHALSEVIFATRPSSGACGAFSLSSALSTTESLTTAVSCL